MKIFKDMFLATKDDCHNLYTLVAFARKILASPLLISNAKMPHKSRTTRIYLNGRMLRTIIKPRYTSFGYFRTVIQVKFCFANPTKVLKVRYVQCLEIKFVILNSIFNSNTFVVVFGFFLIVMQNRKLTNNLIKYSSDLLSA